MSEQRETRRRNAKLFSFLVERSTDAELRTLYDLVLDELEDRQGGYSHRERFRGEEEPEAEEPAPPSRREPREPASREHRERIPNPHRGPEQPPVLVRRRPSGFSESRGEEKTHKKANG